MSELKLEVGKRYNLNVKPHPRATLFMIFNDDLVFRDGEETFLIGKSRVISEYTEPKKLSGFVVILKTYESHTVRCDNKELLDSSFGLDNIAACIDLSQFNVGEGLE